MWGFGVGARRSSLEADRMYDILFIGIRYDICVDAPNIVRNRILVLLIDLYCFAAN